MLMRKALLDGGFLHGDCMTVTGKTMRENLAGVEFNKRPDGDPSGVQSACADGRRCRSEGSLAPEGAIVKVAGLKRLQSSRPGARLRLRGGCLRGRRGARNYQDGDVIVIRYEGPKGGPGMREMLSTTAALYGQGAGDKVALITDGRFSGAHARVLHRPCRAGSRRRWADRPVAGWRHHRRSTRKKAPWMLSWTQPS